jgi:hypothetical protein
MAKLPRVLRPMRTSVAETVVTESSANGEVLEGTSIRKSFESIVSVAVAIFTNICLHADDDVVRQIVPLVVAEERSLRGDVDLHNKCQSLLPHG